MIFGLLNGNPDEFKYDSITAIMGIWDFNLRACALVGYFLQRWATMELALNGAIGTALGLDPLQGAILAANASFTDKLNILKTSVDVGLPNNDEKKKYTKGLESKLCR